VSPVARSTNCRPASEESFWNRRIKARAKSSPGLHIAPDVALVKAHGHELSGISGDSHIHELIIKALPCTQFCMCFVRSSSAISYKVSFNEGNLDYHCNSIGFFLNSGCYHKYIHAQQEQKREYQTKQTFDIKINGGGCGPKRRRFQKHLIVVVYRGVVADGRNVIPG
jgi:hypothetical protein